MSLVFRRKVLTTDINLGSIWTISEIKTMDGDRGRHTKAREGTESSCEMPGQTEQQAKAETGSGLRGRRNMSLRWAHKQSRKCFQQEGLISTAGVSAGDWKPDWSSLTVSGRWGHENKVGANDSFKKMLKWQTERSSHWWETWRSRAYFGGAGSDERELNTSAGRWHWS